MKIYVHKGVPLYKKEVSDNIEGFFPLEYVELKEDPCLQVNVGKMSLSLWRTIAAFFRKVNKDEKAEAQVRLFYSDEKKQWKAHAFPQKKDTGMTTKELGDHPQFNAQMEEVLENGVYYQWGTIHSHCNAGAFQSGTDKSDETSSPGLHITMGKIGEQKIDLHSRFTLIVPGNITKDEKDEVKLSPAQKYLCSINLSDFVEIPENVIGKDAPKEIAKFAFDFMITNNCEDDIDEALIKLWMDNRIEEPKHSPITYPYHNNYSSNEDWYVNYKYKSRPAYNPPEKTEKVLAIGASNRDWLPQLGPIGVANRSSKAWDNWDTSGKDLKKSLLDKKKKKRDKKGKPSNIATISSKEEKEILEPLVDNVCTFYKITQMQFVDILNKPDHAWSIHEMEIVSAADANILSAFGINTLKLATIIEGWARERAFLMSKTGSLPGINNEGWMDDSWSGYY
jgi:hypothetical protein